MPGTPHPYTSHPDLVQNPTHLHRLRKHILNYLAIGRKHLSSPEIFAQERQIRDKIWAGGGTAWLRVTAEILNRPLIRSMDGHPVENRATRRAAEQAAQAAAAHAQAEARDRAMARADERERERGNSADPEVRRDWVRDHPYVRPENIPATDEPGAKPAWKLDPAGIAPPKSTRPSTFGRQQAAERQRLIPDPALADQVKIRAQRAFDREMQPDPMERASEHSRSFPRYYIEQILRGAVPMPPEDAPNRGLVEAWISTEIDRALNPFGHRDRTHSILPAPLARAVEATVGAADGVESQLGEIVATRQKGR